MKLMSSDLPSDLRFYRKALTLLVRSTRAGRAASAVSSLGAVVLSGVLCVNAEAATPEIQTYKIYAHIKLMDTKEFICVNYLWNRESNWNPKAKNKKSSAMGIPQLLNMKETDPFKQIDLGLKYIKARYSTACNAWAFFKVKGYY